MTTDVETFAATELVDKLRYTSKEWLARENEHLWPKVWQFACRVEDIEASGDYVEYRIADQSILIIRQVDGSLRGFHNACPHRGTRLATGSGHFASEIRCRFHGWRFGTDGSNRAVIDAEDFCPDLIAADAACLSPCRVDVWAGFVFVTMDPDAEELLDYLAPIPDLMAGWRLDEMRLVSQRGTVLPANWKTLVDAFAEGYHIPATHPTMLKYFDDTKLRYEALGRHSRFGTGGVESVADTVVGHPSARLGTETIESGVIITAMVKEFAEAALFSEDDVDAAAGLANIPIPDGYTVGGFFAQMRRAMLEGQGIDCAAWSDDDLVGSEDFHIFPNFLGPFNPGNMLLYRARPNGDDPDSCLFEVFTLARVAAGDTPPAIRREFFADWRDNNWGTLLTQDFENVGEVQAGMHSTGFAGLRLGVKEVAVSNFHRNLSAYVKG